MWVPTVTNVVFAYLAMQVNGRSGDKVGAASKSQPMLVSAAAYSRTNWLCAGLSCDRFFLFFFLPSRLFPLCATKSTAAAVGWNYQNAARV